DAGVDDVRAGPDDTPSREATANAGFGEVSEERSQELQARVSQSARRPQAHGPVRVLQVARDRPGAEVDPAAKVRVADEAIVALVRVAQNDGRRELSVHLAMLADRAALDAIHRDGRLLADVARTDQSCERADDRAPADEDGSLGAIHGCHGINLRAVLDIHGMGVALGTA